MDDTQVKAKQKILQEIMDMMDEKMVGDLKGKSPKFAKVDIQSDDPELAESLKDKLVDPEEESESPMEMLKEKMNPEMEAKEQSPEDEEDMKRLLAMYKDLK